jgi:hypothetical protein
VRHACSRLEIADPKLAGKTGPLPAVSELQHHLAEGFRVRDIFYTCGLYVILERPSRSRDTPTQTSER